MNRRPRRTPVVSLERCRPLEIGVKEKIPESCSKSICPICGATFTVTPISWGIKTLPEVEQFSGPRANLGLRMEESRLRLDGEKTPCCPTCSNSLEQLTQLKGELARLEAAIEEIVQLLGAKLRKSQGSKTGIKGTNRSVEVEVEVEMGHGGKKRKLEGDEMVKMGPGDIQVQVEEIPEDEIIEMEEVEVDVKPNIVHFDEDLSLPHLDYNLNLVLERDPGFKTLVSELGSTSRFEEGDTFLGVTNESSSSTAGLFLQDLKPEVIHNLENGEDGGDGLLPSINFNTIQQSSASNYFPDHFRKPPDEEEGSVGVGFEGIGQESNPECILPHDDTEPQVIDVVKVNVKPPTSTEAVCHHCGTLSRDLSRCEYCGAVLPTHTTKLVRHTSTPKPPAAAARPPKTARPRPPKTATAQKNPSVPHKPKLHPSSCSDCGHRHPPAPPARPDEGNPSTSTKTGSNSERRKQNLTQFSKINPQPSHTSPVSIDIRAIKVGNAEIFSSPILRVKVVFSKRGIHFTIPPPPSESQGCERAAAAAGISRTITISSEDIRLVEACPEMPLPFIFISLKTGERGKELLKGLLEFSQSPLSRKCLAGRERKIALHSPVSLENKVYGLYRIFGCPTFSRINLVKAGNILCELS